MLFEFPNLSWVGECVRYKENPVQMQRYKLPKVSFAYHLFLKTCESVSALHNSEQLFITFDEATGVCHENTWKKDSLPQGSCPFRVNIMPFHHKHINHGCVFAQEGVSES